MQGLVPGGVGVGDSGGGAPLRLGTGRAGPAGVALGVNPRLRRRMKNELNFPPNFEMLVLGCIDSDFCK